MNVKMIRSHQFGTVLNVSSKIGDDSDETQNVKKRNVQHLNVQYSNVQQENVEAPDKTDTKRRSRNYKN